MVGKQVLCGVAAAAVLLSSGVNAQFPYWSTNAPNQLGNIGESATPMQGAPSFDKFLVYVGKSYDMI